MAPSPADLSPTQSAIWVAERVHRQAPLYAIPVTLRLRGRLDHHALARAFDAVVARHDVLRSCFPMVDGRPVAAPAAALPKLGVLSLQDEPDPEETARAAARQAACAPFDLVVDAPIRAELLALGEEDHVLLLTVHHIAVDWWSVRLILRDMIHAYEAALAGAGPLLPASPYPYWKWANDRTSASAEDLAYWRQHLEGCPMESPLATDNRRRSAPSHRGAVVSRVVGGPAHAAFRTLCKQMRATPFVLALALFKVVLARIGDRQDIVVSAPFANRDDELYTDTVGLFSTMHLLRTHIDGASPFRRVVADVRSTVLDVFDHNTVAVANLADVVGTQAVANARGFPVAFQLLHGTTGGHDLPQLAGLEVERFGYHGSAVRFELELQVYDSGTELAVDVNYAADLFEPATIEHLVRRLEHVLLAVADDPDRAVGEVDVLFPEEHALIDAANDTRVERDQAETVVSMVLHHARQRCDQPAIVADGTTISYRQLDADSAALAERLRRSRVGRGDVVGVAVGRGASLGVAFLAVLRLGAVLLPIDVGHPVDRIRLLLEHSGARAVVGNERLAPEAVPPGCRAVTVTESGGDLGSRRPQDVTRPDGHQTGPGDPAYLIYTSGTTGTPKGVLVGHRSLANLLRDPHGGLCHRPAERCSSWASPSFDVALQEILSPLARGGVLAFVPEAVRHRADALFMWLAHNEIDSAYLPPFHVPALARWLEQGRPFTLRNLMVGVEPISSRALATIVRHAPALQLTHGYGPTEVTVCATATVLSSPPAVDRPVPIGRPVANVRAAVLDRRGMPLPPGCVGDLHFMGTGLAIGYHRRPAETAAAFVAHGGDGTEVGARAYRTGDRARWLANGELEFVGREDRQVKVRGMRIELGEVEHALRGLPGVRQAVAVIAGRDKTPRLVAFVSSDGGSTNDDREPADLTAQLARLLPSPMLPSAVVVLDELPMLPTGKVDRRALEAMVPVQRATVAAGANATAVVDAVWCDVLGLAEPDDETSFFDHGGDSLRLVELVTLLANRLGVDEDRLPLEEIYEDPTLPALRRLVLRAQDGTSAPRVGTGHLAATMQEAPGAPLYLVHPIGGDVSCYADLARALDGRVPVVGIGARAEAPTTLDATAASVARTVIAHGAAPGYHLGGWSYGGVVALAAAQHLAEWDTAPRTVVLFDAVPPSRLRASIPVAPTEEELVADLGRELAQRSGRAPPELSLGDLGDLATLVETLRASAVLPPRADLRWARRYARAVGRRLDGLRRAPDPAYDGDVVLVLGSPGHASEDATVTAWRAACPNLTIERTEGDHVSMLIGDYAPGAADVLLKGLGLFRGRTVG